MTEASDFATEAALYTDRYVALIDVLGFSELIRRSLTEPEIGEHFLWILDRFDDPDHRRDSLFQFTNFSDSFVTSIPVDGNVFPMLLKYLAMTSRSMAMMGFPLRGAIVRGATHHRDNRRVIGPAIVRAHDLETRTAIYPRIILDPLVENDPPAVASRSELLQEDVDGMLFVHFLAPSIIHEAISVLDKVIWAANLADRDKLASSIVAELNATAERPDVLIKQRWLRNYVRRNLGWPG